MYSRIVCIVYYLGNNCSSIDVGNILYSMYSRIVCIVYYLGNNCSWIDVENIPYSMRQPRMTTIHNEPYLFGGCYVSFIISSFLKNKSKIFPEFNSLAIGFFAFLG